jgi:hypothetical protein
MSAFATNHMFSHAHTLPAYTDRGASGFVGRFQLPFARPLHTAAATPSAAAIAPRNGVITKTRRGRGNERRRRRLNANVAFSWMAKKTFYFCVVVDAYLY